MFNLCLAIFYIVFMLIRLALFGATHGTIPKHPNNFFVALVWTSIPIYLISVAFIIPAL